MKKAAIILFLVLLIQNIGFSQNTWQDNVRKKLSEAKDDTTRVLALAELSSTFKFNQPDSAMFYAAQAIILSRQIIFPRGEAEAMRWMVVTQSNLGNEALALKINLQALKMAKENNLFFEEAMEISLLGLAKQRAKDYETAMQYFRESKKLFDSIDTVSWSALNQINIGSTFLDLNQLDSALYYCRLVYENKAKEKWVSFFTTYYLGEIYRNMGNYNLALYFHQQTISLTTEADFQFDANWSIAKVYREINKPDSSNYYAQKALEIAQESGFILNLIDINIFLSELFEHLDSKKALQYSKTAINYKDSLDNIRNTTAMESFMDFDEQQRQFELEKAKTEYNYRLRRNAFLGSTFILILIAIFLLILNKRKQKAKQKIESAYDRLKAAQTQLIQSEKMASLGELTAGIAHEIQNPLNFVNNFSEVSRELIGEMNTELENGDINEAKEIGKDIEKNLEKIHHHGERASSIVKGMLQHSRTSSGHKELTNINALADEYLRLSYHGMRAKDKSFNADFKTDFDLNLPKINVIPQDIGRVLLNLINNAFYAVQAPPPPGGGIEKSQTDYKPTVIVRTSFWNPPSGGRGACISVSDNGPGIPSSIIDKIFQPFFTTKPTGQGTGLGLSLSYDIVKAHGGTITVESAENNGTEFIIQIPMN